MRVRTACQAIDVICESKLVMVRPNMLTVPSCSSRTSAILLSRKMLKSVVVPTYVINSSTFSFAPRGAKLAHHCDCHVV